MRKKTGNKLSISIGELFIYLFFSFMFGMRMWGVYESKPLYIPLLLMGMLFWAVGIVLTRHTLLEYVVIVFLMGLAACIYLNSGEKGLILYFAMMLGMKGIDPKRLFRIGAIVGGTGLAVLSFLAAFGCIEDVAYVQSREFVGEVFRRSLGASHPNTLSSSFTIIAIMVLYVVGRHDRRRLWKESMLLFLISVYFYLYSGSRTGIAITVGFLILNLFYSYRNKVGIPEKIVLVILFPLIWSLCIIGPAMADDGTIAFVRSIDFNLGSRWAVASYYLKNNGVSLFGQRLNNPDANVYGIDMSQLYLLLQLGIVAFIIITVFWIFLLYDEVKKNRIDELVITFVLLVMGITDPFLYDLGFKNLAFAFMGVLLYTELGRWGNRLPLVLKRTIVLPGISDKTIAIPEALLLSSGEGGRRVRAVVNLWSIILMMVMLGASVLLFILTPTPKYVLADRYYSENKTLTFFDTDGTLYSKEEIEDIKKQGNIVLHYSGEQEPMYIYYALKDEPVEGGYYAPNAAIMEKFRISVSVFFWGMVFIFLFKRLALE